MILTSSCSTVTSISSPSNPLMTTSSAFDGSIHGVFMVLVLSCDELLRWHHEHHRPTPQKICRPLPVFLRRHPRLTNVSTIVLQYNIEFCLHRWRHCVTEFNAECRNRQVVSRAVGRTQRATATPRNANQPHCPVDGGHNTRAVRAPGLQIDHVVRPYNFFQHFPGLTGESDCRSTPRPPWAHTA